MKKGKYSIYEIEKMTLGKLSKYKLKKAIQEGSLVAEYLDPDKSGRGAPKYLVSQEALDKYLRSKKNAKIKINTTLRLEEREQTDEGIVNEQIDKHAQLRQQKEHIADLKNRIQFLETQNAKIEPILRHRLKDLEAEAELDRERREIILELASMNFLSPFSIRKKRALLKRLNQLI
ncbi:MAG: hypothetical protein VW378_01570 [bacterium]